MLRFKAAAYLIKSACQKVEQLWKPPPLTSDTRNFGEAVISKDNQIPTISMTAVFFALRRCDALYELLLL